MQKHTIWDQHTIGDSLSSYSVLITLSISMWNPLRWYMLVATNLINITMEQQFYNFTCCCFRDRGRVVCRMPRWSTVPGDRGRVVCRMPRWSTVPGDIGRVVCRMPRWCTVPGDIGRVVCRMPRWCTVPGDIGRVVCRMPMWSTVPGVYRDIWCSTMPWWSTVTWR